MKLVLFEYFVYSIMCRVWLEGSQFALQFQAHKKKLCLRNCVFHLFTIIFICVFHKNLIEIAEGKCHD